MKVVLDLDEPKFSRAIKMKWYLNKCVLKSILHKVEMTEGRKWGLYEFFEKYCINFFCSISTSERQLYEVAAVAQHSKLLPLIERAYPNLDSQQLDAIYGNIVQCMNYKEHVRSPQNLCLDKQLNWEIYIQRLFWYLLIR